MGKPVVLQTWREVCGTMLEDGPPKAREFSASLFVNNCSLRRRNNGVRYLIRSSGAVTLTGRTRDDLDEKVAAFVEEPDVRLLAKGLETNDWDALPREQNDPDQSVIDGTADIYARLEELEAE